MADDTEEVTAEVIDPDEILDEPPTDMDIFENADSDGVSTEDGSDS